MDNNELMNHIKNRLLEEKITDGTMSEWKSGWNKGISISIKTIDDIIDEIFENYDSPTTKEAKICPFLTNNDNMAYCDDGKLIIYNSSNQKETGKCCAWVEEETRWSYFDERGYLVQCGEGAGAVFPGHCKRMK